MAGPFRGPANAGVNLHGGLGAEPMRSSVFDGARTAELAGREPCQFQRLVGQQASPSSLASGVSPRKH